MSASTPALRPEALREFQRAALMRDIFFRNTTQSQPNASQPISAQLPQWSMRWLPQSLAPSLRAAQISAGAQSLSWQGASLPALNITLPTLPANESVRLSFTTNNGASPAPINGTGYWRWLRLIDAARLRPTGRAEVFLLDFPSDNPLLTVEALTDSAVNPWSKKIFSGMRCPESLL